MKIHLPSTPYVILIFLSVLIIFAYIFRKKCFRAFLLFLKGFPISQETIKVPPFTQHNEISLLINGNEILPEILNQISSAKQSIQIQTMLFQPDQAGETMAQALCEASQRGVSVQILFDLRHTLVGAFYELKFKAEEEKETALNQLLQKLRENGVTVIDNVPGYGPDVKHLSKDAAAYQQKCKDVICFPFNHTDHRKIFVFDGHTAIIGGTNIGNEYLYFKPPDLDQKQDTEALLLQESGGPEAWEKWLDVAVLITGPAALELQHQYNLRSEVLGGVPISSSPTGNWKGKYPVQVVSQRPGNEEIADRYLSLIKQAKSEILISSPYVSYLPALNELMTAAKRGVSVKFVFPGDSNDVEISQRVFRSLTRELMNAGVEVYESNRRMIHSKVMVVDRTWVTLGSCNFNYRSFNHDFEQNIIIESGPFAKLIVRDVFEIYFSISELLDKPYQTKLNLLERLIFRFT